MDVTAEQRAHLQGELQRTLGEEATTTMMAHLPEGGAATLATKDDVLQIREDLERFATKEDLERFATKEDLERFATKEDLERFATKEDLERFATKEDLERFATKEHLDNALETMAYVVRTEWKDDLVQYVTRQGVIQIVAIFAIVFGALAYAGITAP